MAKRSRYTAEFKKEAVRLLESGEKPATQIAKELGLRRKLLYDWQAALARSSDGSFRSPGRPPVGQESEVSRLKRELARVTEERDILKKAAAYFAKELK